MSILKYNLTLKVKIVLLQFIISSSNNCLLYAIYYQQYSTFHYS